MRTIIVACTVLVLLCCGCRRDVPPQPPPRMPPIPMMQHSSPSVTVPRMRDAAPPKVEARGDQDVELPPRTPDERVADALEALLQESRRQTAILSEMRDNMTDPWN